MTRKIGYHSVRITDTGATKTRNDQKIQIEFLFSQFLLGALW